MNETIDARLGEAGIAPQDVQTRLDGRDKAFVITPRELVYADTAGVQRASLREVSKVASGKTGALSVTAPSGTLIEASVRGFDVSELKLFFDAVKSAIARAKAGVPSADRGPDHVQAAVAESGSAGDEERPGFSTTVMPASVNARPAGDERADGDGDADPRGVAAARRDDDPVPADDPWGEAPAARLTVEPEPVLDRGEDRPVAEAEDPWADPVAASDLSWSDPLSDAPTGPRAAHPAEGAAWSGERLEPAAAFEPSASRHPTLAPAGTSLDSVAQVLRVAAFLVGLVGVVGGAFAAQAATTPSGYLAVAAWIVGGLTAAIAAFTVAEVARAVGRAAADLQAVRRATLGH